MDTDALLPTTWGGNYRYCYGFYPTFCLSADIQALYSSIERSLVNLTFKIPRLRQAADAQVAEAVATIDEKIGKLPPGVTSYRKIPKIGMSDDQVISEIEQ